MEPQRLLSVTLLNKSLGTAGCLGSLHHYSSLPSLSSSMFHEGVICIPLISAFHLRSCLPWRFHLYPTGQSDVSSTIHAAPHASTILASPSSSSRCCSAFSPKGHPAALSQIAVGSGFLIILLTVHLSDKTGRARATPGIIKL